MEVMPLGHIQFVWKEWCINFKGDPFDWKLKILVPLLRGESDWRATGPPFPYPEPSRHQQKLLKERNRMHLKRSLTGISYAGRGGGG